MSKEYVGAKVKARVSKGQVSSGKEYFPKDASNKMSSNGAMAKDSDYPDTADSIREKQSKNEKSMKSNKAKDWFVT